MQNCTRPDAARFQTQHTINNASGRQQQQKYGNRQEAIALSPIEGGQQHYRQMPERMGKSGKDKGWFPPQIQQFRQQITAKANFFPQCKEYRDQQTGYQVDE